MDAFISMSDEPWAIVDDSLRGRRSPLAIRQLVGLRRPRAAQRE
jgi:hypothetical protein